MADAETQTHVNDTYLNAEVSSIYIVSEEQVSGTAGGSAHFEELHQVKELAVDVSTH